MSYFDVPPKPDHGEWRTPEWFAAPRDELGIEIVVDQAAAQSETAVITLRSIVAYSNGFELRLLGEWAKDSLGPFEDHVVHPHSEQFLRVAVEYADARRATNMDYTLDDDSENDDDDHAGTPPHPPYIGHQHPQFFNERQTHTELSYWIWSIPPAGDLTLVCEWPAVNIPVSRMTVDGDGIRQASARSQKLW
jgi:hypothetical protein